MSHPRRTRLALLVVGATAALAIAGALPALAATPPAGDPITAPPVGETVTREWTGSVNPGTGGVGSPAACVDGVNSDHYEQEIVFDTPDYYTGGDQVGFLFVQIAWEPTGGEVATQDLALFVVTPGGDVHSSDGGDPSEAVAISAVEEGIYEVITCAFAVAAPQPYEGTFALRTDPPPPPNPPRETGGLEFDSAVVMDLQRTEGEPINYVDSEGVYWESGPWGFGTGQGFIHRSTDGGDSFHIASPIGIRSDAPPGGGDSDILTDDQGNAYFADLEGLVNIGCAVSNDGGNTWRKNPVCAFSTGVDRQWLAVDNGNSPDADDNTVFHAFRQAVLGSDIYSTPGSNGIGDPVGGLLYENSSADAPEPASTGAPCGQLRFDPLNRFLYYPCASEFTDDNGTPDDESDDVSYGAVELTIGGNPDDTEPTFPGIAIGQRTGITYVSIAGPPTPGGIVGDIFPTVSIDEAGTAYLVWVDEADHNVYYSFATNLDKVYQTLTDETEGNEVDPNWVEARQVNGGDAESNLFPWSYSGAAGHLSVVWYGSPTNADSDVLDSWYDDPLNPDDTKLDADDVKWYGYASIISGADSVDPAEVSYAQNRFTHKPMHMGQICNLGLGCTVSGGDRTMADFFAVYTDPADGRMRIVFNDTTSQYHGAHLFEATQISGLTAHGVTLAEPASANPMADPTEDAQWPHYAPIVGPGPNHPQFDFTRLELSQPDDATLRIEMEVADLSSMTPPEGKTQSLWLTRFQALSLGDYGEDAWRIFYVGMQADLGGAPSFFAGSGVVNPDPGPGGGCFNRNPEECKVVQYPAEFEVEGTVEGNVITIDVPLQGGFGEDRPLRDGTLYSVTAFAGGRNDATADLYADVDLTRAFDYVLATGPQPPPPTPTPGPTTVASPSASVSAGPTTPPSGPGSPTRTPQRVPLPNTAEDPIAVVPAALALAVVLISSVASYALARAAERRRLTR